MRLVGSMLSMCVLGLSACAAAPGDTGGRPGYAGTRWVADGADARTAPRLEFLEGGRVAGFTGCNMLSGAWRMEGGELRLGNVATTKRMCAGPEGEIEKRLLAAIGADTAARREGTKLVLTSPAGARFEFVPAAP